jgi:hypothetical protein
MHTVTLVIGDIVLGRARGNVPGSHKSIQERRFLIWTVSVPEARGKERAMVALKRILMCAVLVLALASGAVAGVGHLGVPAAQHVQLSFLHRDGDPTNVFRVVCVLFPDGTSVNDYRIPKGTALVITDIHMQIVRVDPDLSVPLDGVLQLAAGDPSGGGTDALLVTLPMTASASQRRTAFSHSFTAGFTFAGKMSPVMTPIPLSAAQVSGNFLGASGYIVSEKAVPTH